MKKIIVWLGAAILIAMLAGCFVTEDKYKKLEENYKMLQEKFSACQKQALEAEKEKANLVTQDQQTKATYDQLMSQLQQEVSEGQIAIQQYENKLTVNVAEKIFFDSGKATLKPGGKEILKKVGAVIKGLADKVVRVEGHTDNVPIAKLLRPTYPTNWELSAARATTVVRFLQDSAGVPPTMLTAAAYSEYQPIAPNDTPENKLKNRRIEIVLQQRDVLKRTEAPIAPEAKGTPAKTEAPSAPVTQEAPAKTEAPAAPAPKAAPAK